ncbi:hypothetical protein WJX73_006516 [Symbiochloris irregularis]|uniref:Uncharacterized protein n=1 Tax=Symbiochloris irregularis TaxID=706552 RepID=A0AAW1PRU1_9CHLO
MGANTLSGALAPVESIHTSESLAVSTAAAIVGAICFIILIGVVVLLAFKLWNRSEHAAAATQERQEVTSTAPAKQLNTASQSPAPLLAGIIVVQPNGELLAGQQAVSDPVPASSPPPKLEAEESYKNLQ